MDSWHFRMGTALLREPARPSQTMAKVSCPAAGRYGDLPEPTLKCGLPNMYPCHPAEVPYAPEIRRSRRSGRALKLSSALPPTRLNRPIMMPAQIQMVTYQLVAGACTDWDRLSRFVTGQSTHSRSLTLDLSLSSRLAG